MQRKPTKNTRGINAEEKRFMMWVKDQPCIQCSADHVIVDHMYGSTFRHNRVLIGMYALLPLCMDCDSIKTHGSHRAYLDEFKETQADSFNRLIEGCPSDLMPPEDVLSAIEGWNR